MLVRLILAVSATFLATVKAQQTNYGQCGGIGWTGPTTCNSGWYCSKGNDYYYQCIPGTATSTTAKPTTTTPVNTTPTRTTTSSGTSQNTATFRNPIRTSNGSDPFMVYSNGYYYLMTTTWSNLQLTRATTINGLKSATPKVIWTDTTASRCCNFWAPEIHWMAAEGRWFIYYSAGTSGTYDNQRIHTIKSSGTDIGSSTWSYSGRITVPNRDVGSIDGTVLNYGGSSYLVYSSWNGSSQDLFIAQLTTATTAGNCVRISTPTYSWEKIGAAVNEGPAPLYHGGRTWIVFSASLCSGTGYELGRIELTGTNPLDPASWTKYSQPIFVGGNGNYEPGHNGFFSGPSGNIYNVYHASSSSPGQCDGSRYTMVQPVNWNSDGTPNLGTPAPLSQNIPEPN